MPNFLRHLLRLFLYLGYLGPLALGAADSSFLFLPVGNDLLLVILVARHHSDFWIYCLSGAAGSALGVWLLDVVAKKIGDTGVQKITGPRRFRYLSRKVDQYGGFLVGFASLAPPPFPFTMLVATTSALAYSTRKLIAIVFVSRLLRFGILSWLAIQYGRHILRIVNTQTFRYAAIGISVLCMVVTGFTVAKWVRAGRGRAS